MMRRLVLIAAVLAGLGVALDAFATANMPMVCNVAAVNAACPNDSWTTAPGTNGKYVAVSGKGVIDWADAAASDLVRVCPADIVAGTSCPVARVSLAKADAAQDAVVTPPTTRWNARVSWTAPVIDANGVALPAGDISSYLLEWHYKIGGAPTTITLGVVTTYQLVIDNKEVCVKVAAKSKTGGEGIWSADKCFDPNTTIILPGAPGDVQVTFTPATT